MTAPAGSTQTLRPGTSRTSAPACTVAPPSGSSSSISFRLVASTGAAPSIHWTQKFCPRATEPGASSWTEARRTPVSGVVFVIVFLSLT